MVEAVDGINIGITPSGNINITQAGVINVTNYATAIVPQGAVIVNSNEGYFTQNGNTKWHYQPKAGINIGEGEGTHGYLGDFLTLGPDHIFNVVPSNTTVTPTTSSQTIGGANYMMQGAVTVAAMPTGTAGTPTASKGTVSNHSITITPSVTNTTGYISGGTLTGTAVTVSASELVSGTYTVNSSGTTDVTNYANISVPSGTATTPATTITATPSISINSSGLITATNSKTQSVSPTISAGYISNGTSGTITVNGSNTSQLTTQAATTITPTESSQQAVASGVYTTGAITVGAISSSYVGSGITRRDETDLSASGATVTVPAGYYAEAETKSVATGTVNSPVATKGTVSNNQISITPSVVVSSGYVSGDTLTGTAVTVSASELVSGTKTITENGNNIDVTNYASVNVNIPSSITIEETADPGGGTVVTITGEQISPSDIPDQIFFIDYDGTILYSYKVNEFNQLTELPANPSHTGLVAQGWNWTLAQIQSQLQDTPDQDIWVGQVYTTASGATEIDVTIVSPYLSPNLAICPKGTITIDWGDETTPDEITGTSNSVIKYVHHQYASAGNYTIKIAGVTSSDNYGFNYEISSNWRGPLTPYNSDASLSESAKPFTPLYSSNISAIRFGDGLNYLGSYSFQYCQFLSITLPPQLSSISSYAFQYCTRLKAIIFSQNISTISTALCYRCEQLQFLSVAPSIQILQESSFYYCYQLKSITLPSSITSIGNGAFADTSLKKVFLPSSLTATPLNCFQNTQLTSLTIPSNVTTISSSLFRGLKYLQSYSYPRSASVDTGSMFYDCRSLSEFILPNNITTLGSNMFRSSNLTSLTIPSGVTTLEGYCFTDCHSLYSITIPNTVTSIGASCFQQCYNLFDIDISNTTITTLENSCFQTCTSLPSITIPNTVTSIGNQCFYSCYALANLTIPSNVTSIGNQCFNGCQSLTTLTIPASVTSIGNTCFASCTAMQEYHFLRTTPPTLGTTAFTSIPSACKIYVPYSSDHSILNAYKTATNWSTYASYIVEESQ